ncbi:hypothetical protein EY643_00320 [Halioglobus maricola]|uniref:Non-specific serine/threonine protein kinase n=1 Tax=Halioglobus maricola TaxID=2601894 RepID=A0A5P9NGA4_9GAMM|nr:lipopolysaccharide kinase InaA family protein [Halioglobus maricola]QFU74214.1 hypothetical protein EY643_00320 [Halioglobus maricola]
MIRLLRGEDIVGLGSAGLANAEGTQAWLESVGEVVKRDRHSMVALANLDGRFSYCKYYRPKGMLQRLQFRFGGGRAVAAFDSAQALVSAGIEVPSPRACALLEDGMLLVTEAFEEASDLKSLWQAGQSEDRLAQLMAHAGAVLASLHEAGFSHGDAKWSNFLVAGTAMYLVDLEAVLTSAPAASSGVRDIARFTLNAEDMGLAPEHFSAFLDVYAEDRSIPRCDIEVRIQPLLSKLRARHMTKYGARGHPLV